MFGDVMHGAFILAFALYSIYYGKPGGSGMQAGLFSSGPSIPPRPSRPVPVVSVQGQEADTLQHVTASGSPGDGGSSRVALTTGGFVAPRT